MCNDSNGTFVHFPMFSMLTQILCFNALLSVSNLSQTLETPKDQCTDASHDGLLVLPRGRSKSLDCVMQNVSMPLEEKEKDVCKLKVGSLWNSYHHVLLMY